MIDVVILKNVSRDMYTDTLEKTAFKLPTKKQVAQQVGAGVTALGIMAGVHHPAVVQKINPPVYKAITTPVVQQQHAKNPRDFFNGNVGKDISAFTKEQATNIRKTVEPKIKEKIQNSADDVVNKIKDDIVNEARKAKVNNSLVYM